MAAGCLAGIEALNVQDSLKWLAHCINLCYISEHTAEARWKPGIHKYVYITQMHSGLQWHKGGSCLDRCQSKK